MPDTSTKKTAERLLVFFFLSMFSLTMTIQAGIELFRRVHLKENRQSGEPYAKTVIRAMDKEISNHIAWDNWPKWSQLMSEYFTQDMIYDTNYFDGTNQYLGNGTGIRRLVKKTYLCDLSSRFIKFFKNQM